MKPESRDFAARAHAALGDDRLRLALAHATSRLVAGRRRAADALPELEALRERAAAIRDHTLAHLDHYLERFEARVVETGGSVHWCRDGEEACRAVVGICRAAGARRITKGKSMVSEEIALNEALEAADLEVTETDLGEYILQLAGEHPSHILAPAIHKHRSDIAALFRSHHADVGDRPLAEVADLVTEARRVLRERFLSADLGITGANFLIAQTGSFVLVTNEGNGDLTAGVPRVHVVVASLEKVVPTLDDASTLLRLLARSATGQEASVYTTLFTGPRRPGDPDGPEELHVVLVDNGRSALAGGEFRTMLRCIKCSACINHCPVYQAVGGHAYGWVYPGPMGSVLTPLLLGEAEAHLLPQASSLCGACEEVCPVKIPLPRLLRLHRERQVEERITPVRWRLGLALWGRVAERPRLYRLLSGITARLLALLGRGGRLRRLPFARSWTAGRDLPAPAGETFMARWRREERS